jgi:hypothetical protein
VTLPGLVWLLLASISTLGDRVRLVRVSWIAALAAAAALACQRPGGRHDSGAREPATPQRDSVVTTLLAIGAEGDPRYEFYGIRGACRTADGAIVVADGESRELRFFDRQGRYRRTAGRKGGGPGEFASLGRLVCRGDSLYAWDVESASVSLFAGGEFVGRVSLARPDEGLPQLEGAFGNGTLLVSYRSPAPPAERHVIVDRPIHLYRVSMSGDAWRVPAPGVAERWWVSESGIAALPFYVPPLIAAGRDGFCILEPAAAWLRCSDEAGHPTSSSDFPDSLPRLSSAEIAAWREWRVAQVRDPAWRPRIGRLVDELPFPERRPLHAGLLLDWSGRV